MSLFTWLFGGDDSQPVAPKDECANFSDDDFQRVALDIVWPGPRTNDSFWGGTVEQCENALRECEALRVKHRDIEPKRLRDAVMSWIDYFERQAKRDMEDVKSQKRRKEMDAYNERTRAESERKRALAEAIRTGRC